MIENIQISTNNTLNALDKKYYASDKASYSFAWVAIVISSFLCALFVFNDCFKFLCAVIKQKTVYPRHKICKDHSTVVSENFELKKRHH